MMYLDNDGIMKLLGELKRKRIESEKKKIKK